MRLRWVVLSVSLAVILCAAADVHSQTAQETDCGQSYGGFDTRLTPRLLSVLPEGVTDPVGFELAGGGPIVATTDRLYAIRSDETVAIPAPHPLTAIAVDAAGRLVLQSGRRAELVGPTGMLAIEPWASGLEGLVHNSGETTFIEAAIGKDLTRFGVRSPASSAVLPIAEVAGMLRAASWDRHGLVAVVGNALLRWAPGGATLERLTVDSGLEQASDVCTIDAARVVVTLPSATLLIAGRTMSVLAAIGGRCRVANDVLYLYAPRLRRVWSLAGITGVGGRERDLAHAQRLLRLAVTQSVPYTRTREFGEAVRLLGCREATRAAIELRR